jgi:DNA-directed RNA polymerase subunit M/transcription elongation factor TFIIS
MLEHTMAYREKVVKLIKDRADVTDFTANDLERGIYNWVIGYATSHGVVKNWENPTFVHLYNDKSRSVICNLDKSAYLGNKRLLDRLKEKEFAAHDIPFMNPNNVFPEIWAEIVDLKIKRDEQIGERKVAAMTDQFKCGKCKKRECSYYEVQLRSADESSTIFITCQNCLHSWKI